MSEKKTETQVKKKGIFSKIVGIKNFEIIVALVLACVVLLIFFSNLNSTSNNKNNNEIYGEDYSFSAYVNTIESKLKQVLSQIDGAGTVDVMVSYASGIEEIYAYTTQTQTIGGNTTETTTLVLVGGKPVLLKEVAPQISGIVVVADGGGNTAVKLEIIRAIRALLDVKNLNIEVFKRS